MRWSYSLRLATDDDYEFLYQLHLATLKPAVEATWGWDEAFQQERFRSHWDPTRRQIIQVEGIDIGTITLEQRKNTVFLALKLPPAIKDRGSARR